VSGYLLTTATVATCPHGGSASFSASQTKMQADGSPVIVKSDNVTISGCPFMIGNVASPCTSVMWLLPATRVAADETAVVHHSSLGLCLSASSLPQGVLQISSHQSKVQGT
jgi:hypothetical protein